MRRAAGCVLMALAAACGDSSDDRNADAVDPQYAVSVQVFSADLSERDTFVAFADSVEGGTLSLDGAVEVAGGGNVWGVDGTGEYFVTSAESPVVTKFEVADGRPVEAGRVGLLGVGVTRLFGEVMVFDGAERAYLFDLLSAQAIELDLERMEILGRVDLTPLLDPTPTFQTFVWGQFLRRDDEWVSFTFSTDFAQDAISDVSRLFFFDPTSGELEVIDAPCGGLQYAAPQENGDLFIATGPVTAATHAVDPERAPAPCLVRLPAAARALDAPVELNPITGAPTGGVIPASGSLGYLRVLDTERFPPSPEAPSATLFGAPGWSTWEVDLAAPVSARRLEDDLVPGGIRWIPVDGEVYENRSDSTFASSQLIRTTGPDAPAPALTTPGVTFAVLRLR